MLDLATTASAAARPARLRVRRPLRFSRGACSAARRVAVPGPPRWDVGSRSRPQIAFGLTRPHGRRATLLRCGVAHRAPGKVPN
jgi:hypothetical protein